MSHITEERREQYRDILAMGSEHFEVMRPLLGEAFKITPGTAHLELAKVIFEAPLEELIGMVEEDIEEGIRAYNKGQVAQCVGLPTPPGFPCVRE